MTAVTPDQLARSTRRASRRTKTLKSIIYSQEFILALSLLALTIIVGIANPRFLASQNVSDVLQGNAYIAVMAVGMSMVIITGNIDISVGSLLGVLATLCGILAVNGVPLWLAWLIPIVIGGLVGGINAFLVAYLRIPAIVATLAMLSILKGGLIMVNGGTTIYNLPDGFGLSQLRVLGLTMPVWFMIAFTIIGAVWMRYSPTGRAMYAVGGNKEAARLSGINPKRIVATAFIFNGVMVGIGSVLYATQFTSIQAVAPPGLEMLVITSAMVGGVSILGGTGTVIGSSLASVLLRAIGSAMVFINVSAYWLQAVQGLLILVTVLVDILRRRLRRL